MKKYVVWLFCFAMLPISSALAQEYQGNNFTLVTSLDRRYAELIVANVEAFYAITIRQFSLDTGSQPLSIYYSKTQADTQKLLGDAGYKVKVEYGYFAPQTSAVYVHQFMNNGQACPWTVLFSEISYKLVYSTFKNCPPWFCEGLACFLGEQRTVVNKDLVALGPNPWREQILTDRIEKGARPNMNRLFSTSATDRFSNWETGSHFAKALFCWLYEIGSLQNYLARVRTDGYDLAVLEKTVDKPHEKINLELLRFIKKNCYAGAYLKDGLDANDVSQKEQAFLKALELRPNYSTALFELAKLYHKGKNYEKCRVYLSKILSNPDYPDYRDAEELLADTYYNKEKDYSAALTHYQAAWEYSDCYEYKYRTAYKIANCYYKLNDPNDSQQWYAKFLNYNWEPEKMKSQVDYAKKYTGAQEMTSQNSSAQKPEPNNTQATEPSNPKIRLQTSLGDIVVELDSKAAPLTVKNFLRYVEEGGFDGTIFHRVIPDFMIQGGGFTPDMQQKQTHAPIINEASNGLKNNRGTVAMARTNNPNSATCQFFINLKNNDFLNYTGPNNPGYAVFGKVVEGMEIVDKTAQVQTTTKGMMADVPVTPIVIKSAKLVADK